MDWVCVVVLVFCASVVSCHPENAPEDGDTLFSSEGDMPSRGAYLAEDRGDTLNPRNDSVTEERTVTSEQRQDGIHHKVTITKKVRVPYTVHVEKRIPKIIEVPVDKPFNVYVPKPYPVIVEKKVPYEIKVPQPQPYTVEKKVPFPVKVLVDKPYTLHVPKPYPVEVEKKYEIQVEKKVPFEVKVPVERRYPVHVIVEKEVKFPVETKVPVPVRVPHDKPIPIHVTKHVPVHVDKPVPYTLEKVTTYPVKVPFRIPIKVHYQEGGSMDDLYSNSYSTPELQNLEWSEAMTSAYKAIQNFEQNHFRYPVRQGFSIPSQRGLYPKNAYYSSPSAKGHQNNYNNYRTPTKLHPVSVPQKTYEVNEAQPTSESQQETPFLLKPDSEIIAPQLLIGSAPQQSTNMLLSQAALASLAQTRNTVPNNSYQSPRYKNDGPSFTISQTVQHNSAAPFHSSPAPLHPSPAPHKFHYISGHDTHFQAVQFGKQHPSFAHVDIHTGDQQIHSQNKFSQAQSPQVPSATFVRTALQNANNTERVLFQKLSAPTAEGFRNHQTPLHQNVARQSHQIKPSTQHHHTSQGTATKIQSGPATTLESSSGRNLQPSPANLPTSFTNNLQSSGQHQQPSAQQQQPSDPSSQNADTKISSSYIGSKTLLGDQEHVYTASIQHNLASQQ